MSDVLVVEKLTRSFQQGGVTIEVLRGVDLTVGAGEIVALLGPSGSGKSTMLQAVGLRADVAVNGKKAIEMAASQAYDLILMDVQMPLMNGLDATRAIRLQARRLQRSCAATAPRLPRPAA